MKKFLLYISIAAIIVCGNNSCTDILNTEPYNAVASEGMWKSESLVDQGVTGVYSALQDMGAYSSGFASKNGSTWAFEQWGLGGQVRYNEALTNGSINPGHTFFSTTWRKLYEGVLRANDAIKNIPALSPAPPEKNARLVAEVKFLRAYYYLRLNLLYGSDGLGVPLYTEPTSIENCINSQSSEDEVYNLIIQDLTDCINEPNLPDKDATGRVSKGAAYALRGKAYLYQGAKFQTNGSVVANQDLLNKAVSDFSKVGELGFSLFQGGYKQLFQTENEKCDEMIFSIQHISEPGYGTRSQLLCGSRYAYGISGGSGWGDLTVSPYIVDLYENADGTTFDWEAVDPDFKGWYDMAPTDRAVFFVRDTADAEGNTIKQSGDGQPLAPAVILRVNAILDAASTAAKAKYLPHGNEARLLKAYAQRDPRLAHNVITPYASVVGGYSYDGPGNAMEVFYRWPVQGASQHPAVTKRNDVATDNQNEFTYFHRKFVYEGAALPYRDDGPTDEPLIRYADVLLLQAEALIELNQLSEAADKINQVRTRSSVDMPPVTIASQDDGRKKVRDERRKEFLNEGVDFFDEIRWKTWKDTKFQGGDNGKTMTAWGATTGAGTYSWPGDHLYRWPVPREETEKNPNINRTPGWTY